MKFVNAMWRSVGEKRKEDGGGWERGENKTKEDEEEEKEEEEEDADEWISWRTRVEWGIEY